MTHETPLIATIVAGIGLAFVFGTIANRLRLPPLVGYLVAGVLVGPHTPGYVADQTLAPELAELGVILLMFGVGLHFSLKDLLSVRMIAVPGALIQIAVATAMGAGLAWEMKWPLGGAIVFGLALSVASTVVLLRAMQERHIMQTERGRIAMGWLIVEDIAMVLALVLLPALAGVLGGSAAAPQDEFVSRFGFGLWGVLAVTLIKIAAFVAFMLIVGRRVIPWILHYVAHTGSRELFRLAVFAIALGVAFGAAKLFGVSLALGAFFAGMILSESEFGHRAAKESLPLRDAFAVLFFVSVGMLFDPISLLHEPLPILATLLIIVIGKSAIAFLIVLAFGYRLSTALTISASLAQVGEFSFILADLGVSLNLLPEQGRDLILAGAILSILINPLAFAAADRLQVLRDLEAQPSGNKEVQASSTDAARKSPEEEKATTLSDHTILIGYGDVGHHVAQALRAANLSFIVIDEDEDVAKALRDRGIGVVHGNAGRPETLALANLTSARHVVLAVPNAFETGQIVTEIKALNPAVGIVARADADSDAEYLTSIGVERVVTGAKEMSRGIVASLMGHVAGADELPQRNG